MLVAMATTLTLSVAPPRCARAAANGFLASAFRGVRLHSSLGRSSSSGANCAAGRNAAGAFVATTICKLKTSKAMAKRFRVTGSGVIMRRRAGKQHLLVGKNSRRRKRLSKMVAVNRSDYRAICRGMPYLRVKRRHVLRRLRRSNVIGSGAAQTSEDVPEEAPAPAPAPAPAAE